MKKLFALLLVLAFALSASPVSAHTLNHDSTIGAIMHISPEDDPQAGSPIVFHFEFKDRTGKFDPNKCTCTVEIIRDGAPADSFNLLENAKVNGLNVDSQVYRFPQKDSYQLKVTGKPKPGADFQAFTLTYPVNVTRQYIDINKIITLTPAQLRHIANVAHWGVGWPTFIAIIIALLYASGRIKGRWGLWARPAGLFASGGFIILWSLLFGGLSMLPQAWTILRIDHQSQHHVFMGVILIIGGITETMRLTKRFRKQKWLSFVSPFCIAAVGLLFLVHPQYGTEEALKHSRVFHFILASTLIIAGGAKITQISLRRTGKRPEYRKIAMIVWVVFMIVDALLLVTYHEPYGAYENFNPSGYQITPPVGEGPQ